jgi:hypothetical protein
MLSGIRGLTGENHEISEICTRFIVLEFCTWLKSLGWGIEILNDVSPNFNRSFLGNV